MTTVATTIMDDGTAHEVERCLRSVAPPKPVLTRERKAALTQRQRELLDRLTELFADGFAHLTMADLAARLNCSLRTLYGLAASREELVLVVLDRNLWATGRTARSAVTLEPGMGAIEAVGAYLRAANMAVSETTPEFALDLAAAPGGTELSQAHADYLVAVARELLDLAVKRGEISSVDTNAVARVVASLGQDFSLPHVIGTLSGSPKDAANHVVDIILRGLTVPCPS